MKPRSFWRLLALVLLYSVGLVVLALALWLGVVLSLAWILEKIS